MHCLIAAVIYLFQPKNDLKVLADDILRDTQPKPVK